MVRFRSTELFSPQVEKEVFTELRASELKEYKHLVQKKVLKGNPKSWLLKDLDRLAAPQYLLENKDPTLQKIAYNTIRIRNRIVEANLGLVGVCAKRFKSNFLEYDDLIQEGVLGIQKAINRFQLSKCVKFSTYSQYWIRAFMRRAIDNLETVVRNPARHRERRSAIVAVPIDKVDLGDKVVLPKPDILLDWSKVAKALESLSVRDQLIMKHRFDGNNATLKEIGLNWDLSRERVRQIQKASMAYLRSRLEV